MARSEALLNIKPFHKHLFSQGGAQSGLCFKGYSANCEGLLNSVSERLLSPHVCSSCKRWGIKMPLSNFLTSVSSNM